jgi:hypothetical protein
MNEPCTPRIPCSPSVITVIQEPTDDPNVGSQAIIVDYPIGYIDVFENGHFTFTHDYDSSAPA